MQLRNNIFSREIIFCRFFVRKTNIGEFVTQKTCNKIIFTKWNFIFQKNYFLQKNYFYKNKFRVKKFFPLLHLQKIYFLKSYLKNASFLSFSPHRPAFWKPQKLKKSARSQNPSYFAKMANFEQKMRIFQIWPNRRKCQKPQFWSKMDKNGVLNFRKGWAKAAGCGQGVWIP